MLAKSTVFEVWGLKIEVQTSKIKGNVCLQCRVETRYCCFRWLLLDTHALRTVGKGTSLWPTHHHDRTKIFKKINLAHVAKNERIFSFYFWPQKRNWHWTTHIFTLGSELPGLKFWKSIPLEFIVFHSQVFGSKGLEVQVVLHNAAITKPGVWYVVLSQTRIIFPACVKPDWLDESTTLQLQSLSYELLYTGKTLPVQSHKTCLDQRSRKVVRFHRNHSSGVCEPLRQCVGAIYDLHRCPCVCFLAHRLAHRIPVETPVRRTKLV